MLVTSLSVYPENPMVWGAYMYYTCGVVVVVVVVVGCPDTGGAPFAPSGFKAHRQLCEQPEKSAQGIVLIVILFFPPLCV